MSPYVLFTTLPLRPTTDKAWNTQLRASSGRVYLSRHALTRTRERFPETRHLSDSDLAARASPWLSKALVIRSHLRGEWRLFCKDTGMVFVVRSMGLAGCIVATVLRA